MSASYCLIPLFLLWQALGPVGKAEGYCLAPSKAHRGSDPLEAKVKEQQSKTRKARPAPKLMTPAEIQQVYKTWNLSGSVAGLKGRWELLENLDTDEACLFYCEIDPKTDQMGEAQLIQFRAKK